MARGWPTAHLMQMDEIIFFELYGTVKVSFIMDDTPPHSSRTNGAQGNQERRGERYYPFPSYAL